MQSIIFITLNLFLGLTGHYSNVTSQDEITIQILNSDQLDFDFSVAHKPRRNQLMVKSDKSIKTLRLVDENNNKTSYDIVGSNLVILPMTDFKVGQEHIMEVKFLRTDDLVLVKIGIPEVKKDDQG